MSGVGGLPVDLHVRHAEFKDFEFKRKELKSAVPDGTAEKPYLVYKTAKEFVEVSAVSAKEAIEKSGVANPLRLKRADLIRRDVLPESFFKEAMPEKEMAAKAAGENSPEPALKAEETVAAEENSDKKAEPAEGEAPEDAPAPESKPSDEGGDKTP